MARIILEYDAENTIAKKIIDFVCNVGVFKVKTEKNECPYNKEFVAKIKRGEKSKGKVIEIEDLWK
ncbi:MAG: hypothetical protein LBH82_01130 [Bacteroidales bacterium]|jgi:hypothetical protein|nr:hypothetical protein [Bacteroidales bacterium]